MHRFCRVLVIGGLLSAAAVGTVPASGAVGTWTKITSPKGPGQPIYRLDDQSLGNATFIVSGSTSSDLVPGTDTIGVYCFSVVNTQVDGPLNASPLAISGSHTFSGAISIGTDTPCVLRAVPSTYTGISSGQNNGYAGAFAGPSFYFGQFTTTVGSVYGEITEAFQQRGLYAVSSPDVFGILVNVAADDFSKSFPQVGDNDNALALLAGNLTSSGTSNHSEIIVDGHNAYPPLTTSGSAIDAATVPLDTFTKSRASNGNVRVTEKLPLSWCTGDSYPQGTGTCAVQPTGVTLFRSYVTTSQGAIIAVTDRFASTNGHQHTLKTEYSTVNPDLDNGESGVMLPGQSSFRRPSPNTTFTSLPVGPHTIYMTSDMHATDGTLDRYDTGLTYSAKPTVYFQSPTLFGLRYSRTIGAGRSVGFAFAEETGFSMTSVKSMAAAEQKALTPHLSLTAPARTTTDNTPTIKGKVTNATNGLPNSVKITIGTKSKTVAVKPSTGAFSVTWTNLANGKHTAKARTTDPSGIVLTASRTFKVT